MLQNDITLIATLAFASLLPFLIAAGTCFIKFSIVLSMVRNAIGLQQVPSNLVIQAIALMMSIFVMLPIFNQVYAYQQEEPVRFDSVESINDFINHGLGGYKAYLSKHTDPELANFFNDVYHKQLEGREPGSARLGDSEIDGETSIFALLPAYALSEIKSAFEIGFYIYLPFIVVDMLVSNILLSLGMMMMSPVTVSLPLKLILFVAVDGWTKLAQGLILQYVDLWT
jgi:type III secretion protein R